MAATKRGWIVFLALIVCCAVLAVCFSIIVSQPAPAYSAEDARLIPPETFGALLEKDINKSPRFKDWQPILFKIETRWHGGSSGGSVYAAFLPADSLCGEPAEVKQKMLQDRIAKFGWGPPLLTGFFPNVPITPAKWNLFEMEFFVNIESALDVYDKQFFFRYGTHLRYPVASAVIDAAVRSWKATAQLEANDLANTDSQQMWDMSCSEDGKIHVKLILLGVSLRLRDPDSGKIFNWQSGSKVFTIAEGRLMAMQSHFNQTGDALGACRGYDPKEVGCITPEVAFRKEDVEADGSLDAAKVAEYANLFTSQIEAELRRLAGVPPQAPQFNL